MQNKYTYEKQGSIDEVLNKIPMVLHLEEDLKIYVETITLRDFIFWKEIMNDEMDSFISNGTCALVDLPLVLHL